MSLETRLLIGPKWQPATLPDGSANPYYYDWIATHTGGDTFAPPDDGMLSATLSSGGTTAQITHGDWRTAMNKGGMWIAGNGADQAWEWVEYTAVTANGGNSYTINNLVRQPTANREHNGIHTNAAVVRHWWIMSMASADMDGAETFDANECASDWEATIKGWNYPQAPLRDGHLILYQTRTSPADDFETVLIGWIHSPGGEDFANSKEWQVKIASGAGMINRHRTNGIRHRKANIALGAKVSSVAALGHPSKERSSGDYAQSEPALSASSTVDGLTGTLYISDQYIGTETAPYVANSTTVNDPTIAVSGGQVNGNGLLITEVHIADRVGQPPGYRYVELLAMGDRADWAGGQWMSLCTENQNVSISLHIASWEEGDRIIVCENETKFRAENPAARPDHVIDLGKINALSVLRGRSASGGAMAVYLHNTVSDYFVHYVAWGTGNHEAVIGNPGPIYSGAFPGTDVAAPSPGQTLFYNFANSSTAASNWTVSEYATPGYNPSDSTAWILYELPQLGLMLGQDITSGYTGRCIITDGTGETTAGLDDSGNMQIGDEIISYDDRTPSDINITARGVSSTTAAAHVTGDAIYASESGLAIDALPVHQIDLVRDGNIVPHHYHLRTSPYSYKPRTPGENAWNLDYTFHARISNNKTERSPYVLSGGPYRARWILLEFEAMWSITSAATINARARLNELEAMLDRSALHSSLWVANNTSVGQFAKKLLTNAGFPAGGITDNTGTTTGGEHATATGLTWDVLTSYAHFAGLIVRVGWDSRITIELNDYLIGEIFTPLYMWDLSDKDTLTYQELAPEPVSQVALTWQSRDGSTGGTVYYPSSPAATGIPLEIAEQCYDDETDAQTRAQRIYNLRRFGRQWTAEKIGEAKSFAVGDIHSIINWTLNSEMQPVARDCQVVRVQHSIRLDQESMAMSWEQAVHLREIGREAA